MTVASSLTLQLTGLMLTNTYLMSLDANFNQLQGNYLFITYLVTYNVISMYGLRTSHQLVTEKNKLN